MKSRATLLLLLTFSLVALRSGRMTASSNERHLPIYDNLFYKGKPETFQDGLILSNILYEGLIWPKGQKFGVLPDRSVFETLVRAHSTNPGPLVIDIEKLPLKGSKDDSRKHLETLATLADWAHAAAPGKIIGFYGTNTLSHIAPADLPYARELARHVDAFFPPMYTFDDDRGAWEKRAKASATEAHALAPGKPVYFYLWPQYHDGTPRQFQFIEGSYWKFQLEAASRYCDGMVLWSPSRFEWNDSTGWWRATQQFAHGLRTEG